MGKDRKAPTVTLRGGAEYAKVATRVKEFHEDNKECSIECSVHFEKGGENTWVIVTATVECPRGRFVQHSMDTFRGKEKFLENLETVAVGRALAVAGYMASGEIASFEEMDNHEASLERQRTSNAVHDHLESALGKAESREELEGLLGKVSSMTTLDVPERKYWTKRVEAKLGI